MRGRRRRVELAAVPPEAGVGVGVGVGRGFIGEEDLGVGLLGVEERWVVGELVELVVDVLLHEHP
jgi:hypothetical protein